MSLAVVFDSAGTLMKTVRAVKEIRTNTLAYGVETTLLVFEDKDRMLILLQAGSAEIFAAENSMPLSEWFSAYEISYAVSFSGADAKPDVANEILKNEQTATLWDLQETALACREETAKEQTVFAMNTGLILNTRTMCVEFIVAAAGYPFAGVKDLIADLHRAGVHVSIASGDRPKKLLLLAEAIGVDAANVHGAATPEKKEQVVRTLQEMYDTVVMVGDGINDLVALRAADYAVLTVQQSGERPAILFDAADCVIRDIRDVKEVVRRFV